MSSTSSEPLPRRPWLLGLGGYAQSGKDSAADWLVVHKAWIKLFMAKPLDDGLKAIDPLIPLAPVAWEIHTPDSVQAKAGVFLAGPFNIQAIRYTTLRHALTYDEAKYNREVRRLLQTLGTEFGRNMISEDLWVDLVFAEAAAAMGLGGNVVITGIRYPNEAAWVRGYSRGRLVWIERPGVGPVNPHSSDNTLSAKDFDFAVVNEGSLEDLGWGIDRIVGVM